MIGDWYDPIEKRWHKPRSTAPASSPPDLPEGELVKAARLFREEKIWDALTSSAEASRQG